ncbi:MAG: class I SAM-dependent methyltransferase [Phycisphaerae bacterium]
MHSIVSKTRRTLAGQLRGKILDAGCGDDLFGQYLRRNGNKVISLDVDAEALRRVPGVKVVASCSDTPFPDDYFDAVWACALIEHVAADTVPEMIRVTRVGGRIVIVTPNRRSPWDPLKLLVGLSTWRENEGHVRLYSSEELAHFGEVHGEVVFLPVQAARTFFWRHPNVGHTLILDVRITAELKEAVRRAFPRTFNKTFAPSAAIC